MPNQPDLEKHRTRVSFHHKTWRRIEIVAANAHIQPNTFIMLTVTAAVAGVKLSAEDEAIVFERIAQAKAFGLPV